MIDPVILKRFDAPDEVREMAKWHGHVVELRPGSLFHIPPLPHDSWVMGDEPYVSLHFLGAERYAT